jgi:hypothetical protein
LNFKSYYAKLKTEIILLTLTVMVLESETRSNRGSDEGASQQSPRKMRNGWSPGLASSVGCSSSEMSDMDEDLDDDDEDDDVGSLDSRKSGTRSPRSATSGRGARKIFPSIINFIIFFF